MGFPPFPEGIHGMLWNARPRRVRGFNGEEPCVLTLVTPSFSPSHEMYIIHL